jgi:hypothetical protein
MIGVISPANKTGANAFKALIERAWDRLGHGIHLLLIDLFPPTTRDPNGIQGALWEEIASELFTSPAEKP